ncbi:glycosyltransferase family 25 protein [Spiribacter insolitus]|uniref:glycosyltransferase family 25 protein n=1 Tax=Spiribacter insolitus TaxID=3122417 RepID=UPI00349FA1B8
MLEVRVISLKGSLERRASVREQFARLGRDFRFFDAVDGGDISNPVVARFSPRRFLIQHGRPHVPGEIGCYASHFLLWQHCIETGMPLVIMEDDLEFVGDAGGILAVAEELSSRFDFIRLEATRKKPSIRCWQRDGRSIVRYLKIPQRLTAYQITPRAARALVTASQTFSYPVDVFVRNQYLHGVPIHGIEPFAVRPRQKPLASQIGDRHTQKGPWWSRTTRFFHRSRNGVLNACASFRHMSAQPDELLPGTTDPAVAEQYGKSR